MEFKIKNREITYRKMVEEIIFSDNSTLILTTGWAESLQDEPNYQMVWLKPNTQIEVKKPKWATTKILDELLGTYKYRSKPIKVKK
jgi:hypothetical protein